MSIEAGRQLRRDQRAGTKPATAQVTTATPVTPTSADPSVAGQLRTAIGDRLPAGKVEVIVGNVREANFIDADGQVDTERVREFAAQIAPATLRRTSVPSRITRQGGSTTTVGRDLYRARHPSHYGGGDDAA